MDSGSIIESEVVNYLKKNIIMRVLGIFDKVSVDVFLLRNGEYDLYMLCLDGLINELIMDEILDVIKIE